MSKNGKITQIIGAVVDVSFENDIQIKANKLFSENDIGYILE